MDDDVHRLTKQVQALRGALSDAVAELRRARGRDIARRRKASEPWNRICQAHGGISRQYAHRLMSEANNAGSRAVRPSRSPTLRSRRA